MKGNTTQQLKANIIKPRPDELVSGAGAALPTPHSCAGRYSRLASVPHTSRRAIVSAAHSATASNPRRTHSCAAHASLAAASARGAATASTHASSACATACSADSCSSAADTSTRLAAWCVED
eukprot:7381288-Prymnesium_polylepis.1